MPAGRQALAPNPRASVLDCASPLALFLRPLRGFARNQNSHWTTPKTRFNVATSEWAKFQNGHATWPSSIMNAPAITNADMLEIQLRKWASKRQLQNVKLSPTYSHPALPVGETVIAEVIDRSGQGLFFTGNGFTLPGRGFIHYDDILKAEWMSSEPFAVKAARKREHFDHIEFLLRDGTSATLMDVEQAVFPLLHFFEWMINKRKNLA